MTDPGLQQEAKKAYSDWLADAQQTDPFFAEEAFIAGFKAAAESLADRVEVAEGFARSQSDREFELLALLESRDQRIKEALQAHRWEANLSGYGGWCSCNSMSMGWKDYIDHLMMALKRAEPR